MGLNTTLDLVDFYLLLCSKEENKSVLDQHEDEQMIIGLSGYKMSLATDHMVHSEASCPLKLRGHVPPQIFEPSGF